MDFLSGFDWNYYHRLSHGTSEMNTAYLIVLIALVFLVILLGREIYRDKIRQIENLIAEAKELRLANIELKERIIWLEAANPRRLNVTSFRELEHAQATNSRTLEIAETLIEFIKNTQWHLTLAHTPDGKKAKQ